MGLSLIFIFVTTMALPLTRKILLLLGTDDEHANLIVVLFSLIPALNIYGAVSLEGILLTTYTIFLLGLVMVAKRVDAFTNGVALMSLGLLLSMLLTYLGLYLIMAGGIWSVFLYVKEKNIRPLACTCISVAYVVIILFFINILYDYSYVEGFLKASRFENPDGFRGISHPLAYIMTRLEGICEIALFLSLGYLAYLLQRKPIAAYISKNMAGAGLTGAALLSLGLLFLAGAFRTGETARVCLFIYPYLLLPLKDASLTKLKDLIALAGAQTAIMQVSGYYYW